MEHEVRNMKKLLALIIISVLLSTAAGAAPKPVDYRRTLFVAVAQKTLVLEAPQGMCFLDQSEVSENALYRAFRDQTERKGDQVMLAVFADCHSIANLGSGGGTQNIPLNAGVVSWMNPLIGPLTGMDLQEYIDMREPAFRQYAENSAAYSARYRLEDLPRRTKSGVALGMSGVLDTLYGKHKSAAVLAATALRHVPIEVTLRFTGENPRSLEKIHDLADTFLARHISLNE